MFIASLVEMSEHYGGIQLIMLIISIPTMICFSIFLVVVKFIVLLTVQNI